MIKKVCFLRLLSFKNIYLTFKKWLLGASRNIATSIRAPHSKTEIAKKKRKNSGEYWK